MRRVALALTIGSFGVLVLLCVVGTMAARSREGADLVVPGAANVRIEGHGTAHLHITYTLPRAQRLHNVRLHLLQTGWVRVRSPFYDSPELVFVRRGWLGIMREVAIVNVDSIEHPIAEISVARCFRIARWVSCP